MIETHYLYAFACLTKNCIQRRLIQDKPPHAAAWLKVNYAG